MGKKMVKFQQLHLVAKVQIIRNGHHYLPITHTEEVKVFRRTISVSYDIIVNKQHFSYDDCVLN
jgi:hypothetical protein